MKHTFLLILLLMSLTNYGQQVEWAKMYSGLGSDVGYSVSAYNEYTYSMGRFSHTVDFDPSEDEFLLTSSESNDIFILKMLDDELVWAKGIFGSSVLRGEEMTNDDFGNILITGYFYGTVDFDPGEDTLNMTTEGGSTGFVLKLDSNGNLIWVKIFGESSLTCTPFAIDTDEYGNIYCTGSYRDTTDFDPGLEEFYLSSAGNVDLFILKLNLDGNFVWAKSIGGSQNDHGVSIATSNDNSVTITGTFATTVDFDPGPESFILEVLEGLDMFVLRLDSSGNFNWAKAIYGTANNIVNAVKTDRDLNVYLTGYFRETADFDPGPDEHILESGSYYSNIFVEKLDSAGNFKWAKVMYQSTSASGGQCLEIDTNSNVFIGGTFEETVDFDPNEGYHLLNSGAGASAFIQKLDSLGRFLWVKGFKGGHYADIRGVDLDSANNCFGLGFFRDTMCFDPAYGVDSLIAIDVYAEIFLLKIADCEIYYGDTSDYLVCDGDTYYWDLAGIELIEDGIYSASLVSSLACDSIVYLNLQFANSSNSEIDTSVCFSFTLPSSGEIVYENGIYHDTLINAYGCDSAIIYNVAINNTASEIITTACDSYTLPSGGIVLGSGTYSDTILNHHGCDSIISIEIDIFHGFYDTLNISTCNEFYWPINGDTYTSSGEYSAHYFTVDGCDSTYILNLNIPATETGISQSGNILMAEAVDVTYQWVDCDNFFEEILDQTEQNFIASENGDYAVIVYNEACQDTSNCILIEDLSESLINSKAVDILIYPNPFSENLNVYVESNEQANSSIKMEIFNGIGQKVFQIDLKSGKNTFSEIECESGIYTVFIKKNDKIIGQVKLVRI